MPKKTVLTRQGYQDLEREIEELLARRPALVERIRGARQMGDLRENFDYDDAKRQQGMLEGRIAELKMMISDATVIDRLEGASDIGLGAKVRIKDLDEGIEEEYTIVGSAEADPADGRISDESCIGAALIGSAIGDVVSVQSPGGVFRYEILGVE